MIANDDIADVAKALYGNARCLHGMGTVPPNVCPCSIECECRNLGCYSHSRGTNRELVTGSSASIQTVGTPDWLIKSVELTWGKIVLDAAADSINKVCDAFIGESTDATALPYWLAPGGLIWCNPPFKKTGKFTSRALASAWQGQTVIMLVLASVGSNWWRRDVNCKAEAIFLNRFKFKGHDTAFMKDLALLRFSPDTLVNSGIYLCRKLIEGETQNILMASDGS